MVEEHNSVERTRLVLQHQAPDRCPVSQPNFMVTARMMAPASFDDFFHDGEAMAEGQIKAWQRFGHDGGSHIFRSNGAQFAARRFADGSPNTGDDYGFTHR